jgi:hypothetical protein
MLTTKTIKDQFGWSDAMILDLLGNPDAMDSYEVKRVFNARKQIPTANTATKCVQTKFKQTIKMALDTDIYISKTLPTLDVLKESVVTEKELKNQRLGIWALDYSYVADHVVDRWCVNHIRHNFTNYDTVRRQFTGMLGNNAAVKVIKYKLYTEMLDLYGGKLNEEIYRQRVEKTNPIYDVCVNTPQKALYNTLSDIKYFYKTKNLGDTNA